MSTKPNLVLIMSDDQGYGDLASYGAPYLNTPNIDGIGRRGMRFTQHYAGSPLCTPSRAALLTGAWPPRVNMPNVLIARDRNIRRRVDGSVSVFSSRVQCRIIPSWLRLKDTKTPTM